MGTFSIWHWAIVFLVIALLFGTSKIKDLGKDLGCSVKGFKESLNADPKSTTDKSEDKA